MALFRATRSIRSVETAPIRLRVPVAKHSLSTLTADAFRVRGSVSHYRYQHNSPAPKSRRTQDEETEPTVTAIPLSSLDFESFHAPRTGDYVKVVEVGSDEETAKTADIAQDTPASASPTFSDRMSATAEIAVSKIFPAGFGWQAAAVLADSSGFGPATLGLALMTGVGDGTAVGLCHYLYNVAKRRAILYSNRNHGTTWDVPVLKTEAETSAWLTSAAFCSGSLWQPVLNFLVASGFGFASSSALTGAACAAAFFVGLRTGRILYPKLLKFRSLKATAGSTYEDFRLSVGIGGAAGLFVGTDVSFAANPFKEWIGVFPATAPAAGMTKAGIATAIGFTAVQTAQNVSGAAVDKIQS